MLACFRLDFILTNVNVSVCSTLLKRKVGSEQDTSLLFQDCDDMKSLSSQRLSTKWCFLDCKSRPTHSAEKNLNLNLTPDLCLSGTTADRFYRIDRAQV